jgi:hypothetical protein
VLQMVATVATGPLENQELMAQGKDLGLQFCASSKPVPNRRKEQENDCEHDLTNLSRPQLKFNGINKNRVFGRDKTPRQPRADRPEASRANTPVFTQSS